MCGRYVRPSEKQAIAEHYHLQHVPDFPVVPDYNIAPRTFQPVIRLSPETGDREMVPMDWGLLPSWVKDGDEQRVHRPINARSDNLGSSMWRKPFAEHHCLVPVDMMIEWPEKDLVPKGALRLPQVYGRKDRKLWSFLGIYARRFDRTTHSFYESFAFITTEANELMMELPHTRIPCMGSPPVYDRWLNIDPDRRALDLLRSFDSDEMFTRPCNPGVGKTTGDNVLHGPEVLNSPTPEQLLQLAKPAPKPRAKKIDAEPSLFGE